MEPTLLAVGAAGELEGMSRRGLNANEAGPAERASRFQRIRGIHRRLK